MQSMDICRIEAAILLTFASGPCINNRVTEAPYVSKDLWAFDDSKPRIRPNTRKVIGWM